MDLLSYSASMWTQACSDRWNLTVDEVLLAEVVCTHGGQYYIVTAVPGMETEGCKRTHATLAAAQAVALDALRAAAQILSKV